MGAINWRRKNSDLLYEGNRGQIIKGVFSATLPGYGLQVDANRQWIERGNADDGGVALSANGAYLFGSRRFLLTYAQTGSSKSFFGGCDRLSVNADLSGCSAEMAGHWGFLEAKAGATLGPQAAAYRADVVLPATAVIPAGGIASAFMAAAESLAGTHTGKAAVMHVPNPQAGTWDAFLALGSATGVAAANTHAIDSHALSYVIKILDPAGALGYIPVFAEVPAGE